MTAFRDETPVVILPDTTNVVRHSWIRQQLESGQSVRQVAEALGVTPQTIQNHLKQMGLRARREWTTHK
jgi:DNA-binding NarL/FixJ family response regulator